MSDDKIKSLYFPPEIAERLLPIVDELTLLWTDDEHPTNEAAAYAASAIIDKICIRAAEIAVAKDHPGHMDTRVALLAVAMGVGNVLALDHCCTIHAIEKLTTVGKVAMAHADAQVRGGAEGDGDLETTQCKGNA
jgi:hypothetical protein